MSKQEIMYSHVESWKQSGLTQGVYCEDQGLKLPTFSYWIQKYHKQLPQEDTSNFITINKEHNTDSKQYEIVYPNGVTLRINTSSLAELSTLLKLV